jgi:AraC-like DNA-binding protein
MRTLSVYAFVLLTEGHGVFRDERGTERDLHQGDLFVVVPEIAHQYGPVGRQTWSEVFIAVDGEVFDLWQRSEIIASGKTIHLDDNSSEIEIRMRRLLEASIDTPGEAVMAAAEVHRIIADTFGRDPIGSDSRTERLGRSKSRIENWPIDVEINWDEIATTAGYSYHAWRRAFRATFLVTPARYRVRVIMGHAAVMLARTDMTNEEIAERLHRVDASHFNRQFKSVYHLTPRQYRLASRTEPSGDGVPAPLPGTTARVGRLR